MKAPAARVLTAIMVLVVIVDVINAIHFFIIGNNPAARGFASAAIGWFLVLVNRAAK